MTTMRALVLMVATFVCVWGCGPMAYAVNFDPAGEGSGPAASSAPEKVRVFYNMAPPGFMSESAEHIGVLEGFSHELVGHITITFTNQCCCDSPPLISRELLVERMKARAAEAGANALVYVTSPVPSKQDVPEGCAAILAIPNSATTQAVGFVAAEGWAVRLAEEVAAGGDG